MKTRELSPPPRAPLPPRSDNPAHPIPASRRRAALAAANPAREPTYSQAELRERRRTHLSHVYGASFSLSAEVEAITEPLARRVAALPNPAALADKVDLVAAAAHEVAHVAIGLLAGREADLAQRPPLPEITDDDLKSGRWAAALVALVEPYSARLGALLGRAFPPNSPELRGHPSASERLEAALRTLDRAALDLGRLLDRAEVDGPRIAAARERLRAHNALVREQDRARDARAALSNI